MPLSRPNLSSPLAGPLPLAAGRVLWCPDFPSAGHWGSNTRRDVSGFQNPMTLANGPLWVPGRSASYGMAVNYDGTDDYAEAATSTDFDSLSCTFAASFRTSMSTVGLNPWIFGRASNTATASANGFYCYLSATNAYISMQVKKAIGVTVLNLNGSTSLNDGRWHRVHMVTTGATSLVSLYIDGVLIASGTPSSAWSWGANPVRSAVSTDTFWDPFDGDMANEAIWNRPLSAGEVRLDCLLERRGEPPVRRVANRLYFDPGANANIPADTGAYTIAGGDLTFDVAGSQGWMLDVGAYVIAGGDATFTLANEYDITIPLASGMYQIAGGALSFTVSQPSRPGARPSVPRVTPTDQPAVLIRHTETVAAILNGLAYGGQLKRFGAGYKLFGAAVTFPRAPLVTDDETEGAFVGLTWVNTSVSPRTLYICMDATEDAAVWKSVTIT